MKKNKLKVGILLDGYHVPAWLAQMVERINNGNYAEISLLIICKKSNQVNNKTNVIDTINSAFKVAFSALFHYTYNSIFERNSIINDAFKPIDLRDVISDTPSISAQLIHGENSYSLSKNDLQQVKKAELDVLIRGGENILRGSILNAAKHGVWSYHHGDNQKNNGGPAGFWEMFENWPETGIVLQKLTDCIDQGEIIYRSYSATNYMSYLDNKKSLYWKALSFIPRKLEELYQLGGDNFELKVKEQNQHQRFYCNKHYTDATALQLLTLIYKKIWQKTKLVYQTHMFKKQWFLSYCIQPELSSSFLRYKKMVPPADRFWADPHVIYQEGNYYIFIEEYIYKEKKGHISVIVMDDKGNHSCPKSVLKKEHHLSYPFVFESAGEYYMIPETAENKTIELYKSKGFPFDWEWQMNLMEDVNAVDTTLYFHENKWWMFVNLIENEGASSLDELFIFHSEEFCSQNWTPHKANPVISDVKSARPAGAIFNSNNHLYRPSQDCSHRYGYGFNINKIDLLTEDEYKETCVSQVRPNWDKSLLACHTFSKVNHLYIIDTLTNRKKFQFSLAWLTQRNKNAAKAPNKQT